MYRWATVAAGAAMLSACAPPVNRGGFDAPDPASKLYAIERAMRNNDRAAVPRIVEQLDSDDPAVRLMAISALKQLTGETHGYAYDAPRYQREEAIGRWVAAVGPPAAPEGRDER